MKKNILKKILKKKQEWLNYYKKIKPIQTFKKKITLSKKNFYNSLKKKFPAYILECKKKSPSLGTLRKNFNLLEIAKIYKKHASAISVVTDEYFFGGSFENLSILSNHVSQPLLCKDFIIDKYQIYLARYHQADAVLLMLSILNDQQYIYLSSIAKKLNMNVLTEINNLEEMTRAKNLKSNIIGINNRNLNDLSINIKNTIKIAPFISKKTIVISESGINNFKKIKYLRKFVQGFLIGTYLMQKKNIDHAIKSLIFGNNKICGLTNQKDAILSDKIGSIYGGLIFYKKSPRNITLEIAKNIIKSTKLKYIAVIKKKTIDEIIQICNKLNIYAIQLYGDKTQEFINEIIKKINKKIYIWKAFNIKNTLPKKNFYNIQKYVFDNYKAGSGKKFDWTILNNKKLKNVFIAGGLNKKNCKSALKFDCFGLDFNSGVEKKPGIKDKNKIEQIFKILRTY